MAHGYHSVQEGGNKLGNTWDTGGTTDQDGLVDFCLADVGITEDPLDGIEGVVEEGSWYKSRVREVKKLIPSNR